MNAHLRRFLLALALLASGLGHAGTKTVSVLATGSGPTEEEATAAALAKAVSQVNGTVSSTSVATGKVVVEGKGKKVDNGKVTTVEVGSSVGVTPNIEMRSSGRVSRYDVQSSTKAADGRYTVTVTAYFEKYVADVYNAPGSKSGKMRLAVFPPSYSGTPGDAELTGNDADAASKQLRNALERAFINGQTYAVLDRQTLGHSLAELGLIGGMQTASAEKAKLRSFRGADIILLPRIGFAENPSASRGNHITGQARRPNSDVTVEIRAIVPATSEVIFSRLYQLHDSVDSEYAMDQLASMAATDLTLQLTGKQPADSSTGTVHLRAQDAPRPLPAPETEGTRLPFDP